jgi:hypothetical protein
MLLFGSTLLNHYRHFDYRNQPLNMRVYYVEFHEASLCCYLVIYMKPIYIHYCCFTSNCDLFIDSPS